VAVSPAFAATPRIGAGHLSVASPDTGANTPGAPATCTVTLTLPGNQLPGEVPTSVVMEIMDTATTPATGTGVFLRPRRPVPYAGMAASVTVPVETTTCTDAANGWTSPTHLIDHPQPNLWFTSGIVTAPEFATVPAGGVDPTWGAARSPAGAVTILTGAPGGTKVAEVIAQATGPIPDGATVVLWLHDGTTAHAVAEITLPAGAPDGVTTGPRSNVLFPFLLLPDETWTLRATAPVVPAAGDLTVTALAGDL